MTRRARVLSSLLAAALVLAVALSWPNGYMTSRDIGCARASDARGHAICDALANSMQWTWMGHAIISPGWRVTWPGLRNVYCREHVESGDTAVLKSLTRPGGDWRLEEGATDLIRLVKSVDGTGKEDETSIFNPRNGSYLLKKTCGRPEGETNEGRD